MPNAHLLLLESNETFARSLADRLGKVGLSVEHVASASALEPAVRRRVPDVVVVDTALLEGPEDGPGIGLRLMDAGLVGVPVIALAEAGASVSFAGAYSIEHRPITVEELAALVVCAAMPGEADTSVCLRVLLTESDPTWRESLVAALRHEDSSGRIEIVCADSLQAAHRGVVAERFDVLLLADELPDGRGTELLDRADAQLIGAVPIGLTSSNDPVGMLGMYRDGCADVLSRADAVRSDRLRRRIDEALVRARRRAMALANETRRMGQLCALTTEALIADARTDRLTGLANRALLDDYHADLHMRSDAAAMPYGMCMIDIDRFKQYNDLYGHSAGDEVLYAVGRALLSCLQEGQLLARFGGEEFTILVEGDDAATLSGDGGLAARLCEAVSALEIEHGGGVDGRVTVSVGTAVRTVSDAHRLDVLRRADGALYQAKRTGRARASHAEVGGAMVA